MEFKDHFSGHADRYLQYRPSYPESLYREIYRHCQQYKSAWDCGTGNGQVAVHLAGRFERVDATDASDRQIGHALLHPRVHYQVCRAEETPFEGGTFDLVTVGQALHWFHFDAFFTELSRVLKTGGVFACWTYRFLTVAPGPDAVLERFFHEIEPYWPPERDHVEARYTTIPFPDFLEEVAVPDMHIVRDMTAGEVMNYLGTWSSVKNYREQRKADPLEVIRRDLEAAWGDTGSLRPVRHPLTVRVFRLGNG